MEERAQLLIDILLDRTARADERDDAATYLEQYTDGPVLEALATVASSEEEDEVLAATAGESLAGIWARIGSINDEIYRSLVPAARQEVRTYLNANAPGLLR